METTETNRTVSKQTKTTLNFLKNTKICSLSNCFGWASVCVSVHLFFSIEAKQPTKTNRNNPKFSKKIPKYAFYQTVLVALLFVSVQSKHRNSLFWCRSETTKTNGLFRIVPKLVSVPVSVVSNQN
jgi:amino acid permease